MNARKAAVLLVMIVTGAMWARFVFPNVSVVAGGADSSGYFNEARMFERGRTSLVVEPLRTLGLDRTWAEVFTPLGFVARADGTMVPTYPPGLPVHLLVAAVVGGWDSVPFYVSAIAGLGCMAMMYLVAREAGLEEWWAVAGAAMLCVIPVFVMHAVQPISDVLATFWTLLMVWLALRALRDRRFAVAAGVAFAIGVWVRPTNLLMLVPLVVALRLRWPLLLRAAAGSIPLGIALMWMNARLFGSPFKTGYGGLGDVVATDVFFDCMKMYSIWLAEMMTLVVFPGGLLAAFDRRIDRWTRWLVPAWFAPLFIFYPLWGVYDGWWYTRFLLPAIPALILGALFVVRDGTAFLLGRWRPLFAAVAGVAILLMIVRYGARLSDKRDVLNTDDAEAIYKIGVAMTERHIPKDAMLVSGLFSGTFLYYSNRFTVRWDFVEPDRFALLRGYAGAKGLKWYALLSDVEVSREEFLRRMPGRWVEVESYRDVRLWRLED